MHCKNQKKKKEKEKKELRIEKEQIKISETGVNMGRYWVIRSQYLGMTIEVKCTYKVSAI